MRASPAVVCLFTLAACASGGGPDALPPPAAAQQAGTEQLPPAGFGTLRVDDIALLFETGNLRIRVLPLDEGVIRLLSPDSYQSLAGMKRLKAAEIEETARQFGVMEPALFSISFYALRDQAAFAPEELTLQSRGRFFRSFGSASMSPGWGERLLSQRGSAVAIMLFEPGMALFQEDLIVTYQGVSTGAWGSIAKVLNRERSAVLARAAAAGKQ